MNHQRRLVALSASILTAALAAAGCGSYDDKDPPASGTGGNTAAGGNTTTGGTTAAGGSPSGGTSGGETPKATCTNLAAPCGGDVVGTWTVAEACLPVTGNIDPTTFGLNCTAAPVAGTLQVSGSFAAMADGTFADNTTTSTEQTIDVPPACLNISGTVTQCSRIGSPLKALGYSMVTCVDAASGGCTCTAVAQQMGGMGLLSLEKPAMGTYTAAANVLTTVGEIETKYDYCVTGNALTVSLQTPGQTGTVSGTIVLTK